MVGGFLGMSLLSAKHTRSLVWWENTIWKARFGMSFNGPVIQFGAMVEYHPISAKDIPRLHQFGPLPGVFLGYVLCAVRIWKGDIMIADIEELEEMDASEIHARRLNAKEVLTPKKWKLHILSRRWKGQNLWVRPASENIHLNLGLAGTRRRTGSSSQMNKILQPNFKTTRRGMMRETKHDFWSITREFIFRHHVVPRVKLYVPREESFPIPMKYIDVTRTTQTSLDVLLETKFWWQLERGWRKRIVRCMDRLHKIHLIERKATWWIHVVWEETYEETNNLSSWWCVAKYVDIHVRCSEKESKTKMGYRETEARQCQTIEENIRHRTKRRRI